MADSLTTTAGHHPAPGNERLTIAMFGHCFLVHVGPLVAALKRTRPGTRVVVHETVLTPTTAQCVEWTALAATYQLDGYETAPVVDEPSRGLFRRISDRLKRLSPDSFASLAQLPDTETSDLYHLHWPSFHSARVIRALPGDKPLVVSFWGHDVLDGTCVETHMFQRAAIARADIVTVRSIDLREHLYSKFGRHFAHKVRIAKFANDMFREWSDLSMSHLRAAFRERHGIRSDSVVIAIGHSGHEKENHLRVLESLRDLQVADHDLFLLLPMTYGGSPAYREEVRRAARRTGHPCVMLDLFTDRNGVWESRAGTDIFVSVPDEDSFSGAMCEFMLAGSVAIVGDWLPYGALRRLQVHHRSVETIADVPAQILAALAGLPAERQRVERTAHALRTEVDIDTTIAGWWTAYDDAVAAASARRPNRASFSRNGVR